MLLQHRLTSPKNITNFLGSDSREKYTHNLKILPQNWKYRNENITYAINSNGYRTVEFDTIDWNNSIVIMGCSAIFGTGLSEQDTVPAQLQSKVKYPVINLGMSGTGPDFQYSNLLKLKQNNIQPRKILMFWPNPNRFMYYLDRNLVDSTQLGNINFQDLSVHQGNKDLVVDYFLNKQHWIYSFEKLVQSSNLLYPDMLNFYYHGNLNEFNDINLPGFDTTFNSIVQKETQLRKSDVNNLSRDLEHWGTDIIKKITIPHILSKLDI